MIVARYLRGGRLDHSFGTRGIFTSALPTANAPFLATAIARDPKTGKIVIAGGYGQGSILVMRLTASGRLDRTFGTNRRGFTNVNIGGIANSLAIQADGRILVGGSNANLPGRPFVVARFTPGGSLDHTFGTRGIVQALFWNSKAASSAGVNTLVPTADGGVIAAGHIDYIGGTGGGTGGHGAAGVFRLTRGGRMARGFGSGWPRADHDLRHEPRSRVVVPVRHVRRRTRPDHRDRRWRHSPKRAVHGAPDCPGSV